jgi:hypothetical protein
MVRFRDGQKLLFNPVQKSALVDRPEERVRLRMIEFLVREAGFSLNRMSTEIGIKSFTADSSLRTDILCFDELHRPLLLVECKSESVKLDEKAAIQIARYNRTVKAPYILLSNGLRDVLFAVREDDSVDLIPDFETVFPLTMDDRRDLTYWVDRSLWGIKSLDTINLVYLESSTDGSKEGNVSGLRYSSSDADSEDWSTGGDRNDPADANSDTLSANGSANVTSDLISSFLDAFWGSTFSETQHLKLHLPDEFAEKSGFDPHISTFFKVFPRDDNGRRVALTIFSNALGITYCLMITSNPESTPTWVMFDVRCTNNALIMQNGWIKIRDEKSVKIPDYLEIEIAALNTNTMDEHLYSSLAHLNPNK